MRNTAAFWDSSALTPVCVEERTSEEARTRFRTMSPVVWWATRIEVQSAIARLHRMRELSAVQRGAALQRLATLSQSWQEIQPGEELREEAGRLLERYSLRAADALQLAAALAWCEQRSSGRVFVCRDVRLCEAAAAAGFQVVQLGVSASGT